MSDERFEFYSDDYLIGVLDTVTGRTFNSFEIVDVLNEQQATIRRDELSMKTMMSIMEKLEEENEQLKQKLENLGLNKKNDAVKMIEGRFFIRM